MAVILAKEFSGGTAKTPGGIIPIGGWLCSLVLEPAVAQSCVYLPSGAFLNCANSSCCRWFSQMVAIATMACLSEHTVEQYLNCASRADRPVGEGREALF